MPSRFDPRRGASARPLRVFVSHTAELAAFPERRSFVDAVWAAVRRAGGVAIDMADFGARDEASAEVCRAEVLSCDVYVGVIGFRYGQLVPEPDDEVSYTEFEFRVARQARIPRLLFLLDEATATVPVGLVDVDRSRVDQFRQRLLQHRVTVFVSSPDDLAARVGEGLAALARDHAASEVGVGRPWMAPPLDRMVERPELANRLIAALNALDAGDVALTTGLAGAGGFGKTMLATWVCHRPEIRRRYAGGLLWATVGQEIHGADLAEKINDLSRVLGGRRPAIFDPDAAGAELGRLLDERLRKRHAIRTMVHALHEAGVPAATLATVLPRSKFLDVEGRLDGDKLRAAFLARYPKARTRYGRWFLDSPLHDDSHTWVLSNQWGSTTVETLAALAALAPTPGFGYEPA